MTARNNDTEIVSFSLPKQLVLRLDRLSRKIGCSARSELIRDGVRLLIKQNESLEGLDGTAEGVIMLLYDHSAEGKVSAIRHRFTDIVRSYSHSDFELKSHRCCEVLVFRGEAERVRALVEGMQAVRKVDEVRVFLA